MTLETSKGTYVLQVLTITKYNYPTLEGLDDRNDDESDRFRIQSETLVFSLQDTKYKQFIRKTCPEILRSQVYHDYNDS